MRRSGAMFPTAVLISSLSVASAFTCDGTFLPRKIPDSYVNDNYCDCEDESDEPGTNACAFGFPAVRSGNSNGMFKCTDTLGYEPLQVPSYVVGDSLCDCCDGSDEVAGLCPNECALWAAEARAKQEAVELQRAEGLKKYTEYASNGKKRLDEKGAQVQAAKADLASVEELLVGLEKEKDEWRAKEEAERKKITEDASASIETALDLPSLSHEELVDTVTRLAIGANDSGIEVLLQVLTEHLPNEVTDALDDVEVLSVAMEASEFMYATTTPPPPPGDEVGGAEASVQADGDVISSPTAEDVELAKEREVKLAGALAELKASLPFQPDQASSEALVKIIWDLSNELKNSRALAELVWKARGLEPDTTVSFLEEIDTTSFSLPEATEANTKFRETSARKRQLRDEIKEMDLLDGKDPGPDSAFVSLLGECFERKVTGFTYKFCLYKDAKQDTTNLGKFEKWDNGAMLFTNGQSCWNGPKRSLKLEFECAPDDEIVSVEEPETCKYAAVMKTPAACR